MYAPSCSDKLIRSYLGNILMHTDDISAYTHDHAFDHHSTHMVDTLTT